MEATILIMRKHRARPGISRPLEGAHQPASHTRNAASLLPRREHACVAAGNPLLPGGTACKGSGRTFKAARKAFKIAAKTFKVTGRAFKAADNTFKAAGRAFKGAEKTFKATGHVLKVAYRERNT